MTGRALSTRIPGAQAGGQEGAALLLAIVLLLVFGTVIATLLPLAVTERRLAVAAREAAECRAAAAAAVAYAAADLQATSDWDAVLSGSASAGLATGARRLVLGDRLLDLDARAATFPQLEPGHWGANTPRWVPYAWGPAADLAPGALVSPATIAVWVADDERDGDGDPRRDSNGRLRLRGEAFGPVHGNRAVVATIVRERPSPAPLRVTDVTIP